MSHAGVNMKKQHSHCSSLDGLACGCMALAAHGAEDSDAFWRQDVCWFT